MARFTLPRDLYFGPGAMEELKNLKGYKKAFIVTGGSSMKKTGFLQKLEDILKAAGLQTRLYDGVDPDRKGGIAVLSHSGTGQYTFESDERDR